MSMDRCGRNFFLFLAALGACLAAGCREKPQPRPWDPPKAAIYGPPSAERAAQEKPFAYSPKAVYEALVKTSLGDFRIGFYSQETPETVRNFVLLAARHYYDGLIVQRVERDVLIQAGDQEGTGAGSPGYSIKGEFTKREFAPGTVGMARKPNDPNSANTTWFVGLQRRPDWDGKFAAFGYVKEGLDVVRRISGAAVEGDLAVLDYRRQRPIDLPVIKTIEIITVTPAPAEERGKKLAGEPGEKQPTGESDRPGAAPAAAQDETSTQPPASDR